MSLFTCITNTFLALSASLFSFQGALEEILDLMMSSPVVLRYCSEPRLFYMVGLSGLEPPTSRLSGVRSNRLSYKPFLIWQPPTFPCRLQHSIIGRLSLNQRVRDVDGCDP